MGNTRKTTQQFKAELAEINPNIEVIGEYIKSCEPISVRCKACNHTWSPIPNHLLHGHGCPKCAGYIPKTTKEFKAELAKKSTSIEVVGEYIRSNKPIKVRCKRCGHVWSPLPSSLLQGKGCPQCVGNARRPVRCVETGEVFESQAAAAKAVGLKASSSISLVLRGRTKTAAGYHWEYTDTT